MISDIKIQISIKKNQTEKQQIYLNSMCDFNNGKKNKCNNNVNAIWILWHGIFLAQCINKRKCLIRKRPTTKAGNSFAMIKLQRVDTKMNHPNHRHMIRNNEEPKWDYIVETFAKCHCLLMTESVTRETEWQGVLAITIFTIISS